ncbi:MAG TPA: GatB/YqeY domain-containing protein [Vicinamibacterales bacterium]|nr:GatB/YqeY domain-containing protein [Vicinamibacterales bacterium]
MAFIDRISADLTAAMRSRDPVKLGTLRMAKAALTNREVERGRPLDDAESLQVMASMIKQRRDSIEQFEKGGRGDLVQQEQAEIAVLEAYLPPPVDPATLERAVDEAIRETGAVSPKDMGKAMKAAMARLAGAQVDGKTVSDLVKRKLAGG